MDFSDMKISNMSAALKKMNRRKMLFAVAAVLVAFLTFYALVLPAITWERTLICDKPEHVHTDECYEEVFVDEVRTLTCNNEEEGHEHTDACYEIVEAHTEKQLVCKLEEHEHDDSCYDAPPSEDEYTCGMVEHTHNEQCYNSDGTLECKIPEHQHTDACLKASETKDAVTVADVKNAASEDEEDDVKPVKKGLLAALKAAPLGASGSETVEKTYWVPVTNANQLNTNDTYMIVVKSNEVALSGENIKTAVSADMQPVSGKSGYYTSELGEEYWWKLSTGILGYKMQNVGTKSYLNLTATGDGLLNATATTGSTNAFVYSNGGWTIYTAPLVVIAYDLYYNDTNSTFSYNNTTARPMLIYKQVTEEGPADEPDNPDDPNAEAIKPDYPAYKSVSHGLIGSTSVGDVSGTYYSDPSSSDLERKFNAAIADNGKLLTDKSVIYGKDDYGAFNSYNPNTFSVTLSALAQSYKILGDERINPPLDVVFVLDTSGSMIDTKYSDGSSADRMIRALNQTMAYVLNANEDNRVGVVCFSGSGHKLLDLGRYTAPNNLYFNETAKGVYNSRTSTLTPNTGIKRTDGGTLYKGSFNQWKGTNTQHGIATGAQLFADEKSLYVTKDVDVQIGDRTVTTKVTMKRQPIFILLSDGDPTYCTSDYKDVLNAKSYYGNGNAGYDGSDFQYAADEHNNNKGILGYYTILSAQYYKEQISKHYGTDARFFTIGIGINETGRNSYSQSVTGDDYKRAVLNPSPENIEAIGTCTTNDNVTCSAPTSGGAMVGLSYKTYTSANNKIGGHSEMTCGLLYDLLHNQNNHSDNSFITTTGGQKHVPIGSGSTQAANDTPMTTTTDAAVLDNPFIDSGYNYADGAFFAANATTDAIAKAFADAVDVAPVSVYGFILENQEPAIISDTIGDGMELKSEPVLNYGGVNHNPVSHETKSDGTTVYHYQGIYTPKDINGNDDGSGATIDLSKVTAEVKTDANGNQVVTMKIPEDAIPVYKPLITVTKDEETGEYNDVVKFYYEDLPARLIYKVGLTAKSEAEIKALAATAAGGEKTYYTNKDAGSEFKPVADKNPYYKNNDYNKEPVEKRDDTTGTNLNTWIYNKDLCTAGDVIESFGNNGKLEFVVEPETTDVPLHKVNERGEIITQSEASFDLYKDEALKDKIGSYTTEEGVIEFEDLIVGETYYLVETASPAGFNKIEGAIGIKVNGVNDIEVLTMKDVVSFDVSDGIGILSVENSSGYILPETGGTGTAIFYTFGGLLIAGALMYGDFLRRKREGRAE